MSNTKGPSVYTCEAVVIAFVCLVAGAAIVGTFWSDSLKSAKRDADEARMERIEKALERLEKKT